MVVMSPLKELCVSVYERLSGSVEAYGGLSGGLKCGYDWKSQYS